MAEGVEALLAMIGAHSARADAAEGKRIDREMKEAIVNDGTTRNRALEGFIGAPAVVVEIVEGKRTRSIVDVFDGFFDRIDRHDGEKRAEDLFLHHLHLGASVYGVWRWELFGVIAGELIQ